MKIIKNKIKNVKNLSEAKKLVERYKELTYKDVKDWWVKYKIADDVAKKLTGFGSVNTCILCHKGQQIDTITNDIQSLFYKIDYNCEGCIYSTTTRVKNKYYCSKKINFETYNNIIKADTPKGLLTAFKQRAKHLQKIINEIERIKNETKYYK